MDLDVMFTRLDGCHVAAVSFQRLHEDDLYRVVTFLDGAAVAVAGTERLALHEVENLADHMLGWALEEAAPPDRAGWQRYRQGVLHARDPRRQRDTDDIL